MSRMLVNIRGTNGSGKSTIPMLMMEEDEGYHYHGVGRKENGEPKSPWITVFPNLKWVALGHYRAKTGGMDTIQTTEEMLAALRYAWINYPSYDIVMEGVIASTIRSTYIDLFNDYKKKSKSGQISPARGILVMNFLPPVDVCIARVLKRNGGKPVKEDQIASKWNTVNKNVAAFKEAGITSIKVDTSRYKRSEMLDKFDLFVEKYRRALNV